MARPLRIEFPGAFYHVIVRGNQRQDIFFDDQDRQEYLKRVKRYKDELSFMLYAYVLMVNHVHLLIETPSATISKIMQRINLTYTQYFNKKYGKVGHLFQGRYKSFLCDRDEYLLSLVRYIHLNPVRANLVKEPQRYRWSSHWDFLAGKDDLVDTKRVLRLFSEKVSQAKRQYDDFINEALGEGKKESLYQAQGQQILGDDEFVKEVEKKIVRLDRPIRKPSLPEIMKAVKEITGIAAPELVSRVRNKDVLLAREVLVGVWRECGHKLVDLQPTIKRDLSILSRLAKGSDPARVKEVVHEVIKTLNGRVKEWRVALGVALAVSAVSSSVPV
jgi:REP element-mobilizing transposase RayT